MMQTDKPEPDDDSRRELARTIFEPEFQAACAVGRASKELFPELKLDDYIAALREKIEQVNAGDLTNVENTLVAQAMVLDNVFNRYVGAAGSIVQIDVAEKCLRMALKAQSQCVRTLESLAQIKNPALLNIAQLNLAHQQQINNGLTAWFKKTEPSINELLGASDERLDARLDAGTPGAASRPGPPLAVVGTVHRADFTRGQSEGGPQFLEGRDPPEAA